MPILPGGMDMDELPPAVRKRWEEFLRNYELGVPLPDWFMEYLREHGSVGGNEDLTDLIPMQHGGLVTRPTLALLGEAGPELVTPLGALRGSGGSSSSLIHVDLRGSTILDAASADRLGDIVGDSIMRRLQFNRPIGA